ncbi:AbrB/SpoV domain-containing protein [Rhizobium phaseoli]|nr:AbrB/SpoV domain-containing protein [Rhizobium phaseoli]
MNVTIRKISNSEGVIIPKEVLQRLGLSSGDSLELREIEGNIQQTSPNKCGQPASAWKNIEWHCANSQNDTA